MTPEALDAMLSAAQQPPLETPDQLADALDRLEAAAEANPADAAIAAAFDALLRREAVHHALPPQVAGVRRDVLVRWSPWCSTWIGTAVEDGRTVMVRAIDADASPRRARQLAREVGRLGIRAHQGVAIVDLPGQPLGRPRAADPNVARHLVHGLSALTARPPCPGLSPRELRLQGERLVPVCLTVSDDDGSDAVSSLAHALLPDGEGPLHDLLRGLASHPPSPRDAAQLVVPALGRELTAMRHHLLARWTASAQGLRTERLATAVKRLAASLPPPRGRAAAGVDLEGQILAITSDEETVRFGPEHAMERVFSDDDGLDAPLARRVLRAQAAAPPNPQLSRQIGGHVAFNDAIGRWLAASLRLRTLSLLLRKQSS